MKRRQTCIVGDFNMTENPHPDVHIFTSLQVNDSYTCILKLVCIEPAKPLAHTAYLEY